MRLIIHKSPAEACSNLNTLYSTQALWPLTKVLQAFRKINAVTVPHLVGVPKNEEEDAKKGL